jgi:23S rRNA pseudouridine1911/1915/1917 synthase
MPILFEDGECLLIDKPPGITVNRAQSVKGPTIQDWIDGQYSFSKEIQEDIPSPDVSREETWKSPKEEFVSRSGMVHRIDKETSGILVIAKTLSSFIELQRQFKEHIVKKTYMAITHGEVLPPDGTVNAPVDRLPWNREHFGIIPGGKESVTEYHSLGSFPSPHEKGEMLTLLELHPKTGRTHQIRVHLKYINHPILGDYLYAGRKVARDDRLWVPRVMLHAGKISFLHPKTGKPLEIISPMPDDMKRILPQTMWDSKQ